MARIWIAQKTLLKLLPAPYSLVYDSRPSEWTCSEIAQVVMIIHKDPKTISHRELFCNPSSSLTNLMKQISAVGSNKE